MNLPDSKNDHQVIRLSARLNSVILPAHSTVRRSLRYPEIPRTAEFMRSYDNRTLFYDVFFDAKGTSIFLIGPPVIGLETHLQNARFIALPSQQQLHMHSRHRFKGVLLHAKIPEGTNALRIAFADLTFEVEINRNYSRQFENERVLFTLSQNNDLTWIADWARFHAVRHGTSGIVLFDNDSKRYNIEEIEDALAGVPGLKTICVVPAPFAFGRADPPSPEPPWPKFLQSNLAGIAFRRFAALAQGLLNCDIDELTISRDGRSIYDHVAKSAMGVLLFRSRWIENSPDGRQPDQQRHKFYHYTYPDERAWRSTKWVLAPRNPLLRRLPIHPLTHVVKGIPKFLRRPSDKFFVAHFRAISTNWKYDRTQTLDPEQAGLIREEAVRANLDLAFEDCGEEKGFSQI